MDELSFFICGAAIVGILLLIFIISTLTRLSTQNDLIGELRKDLKKLRNEMLGEKDRIKSEMGERFERLQKLAE